MTNIKQKVEKVCYACGFELYDYPYHPEALTTNIEVICPCCGIHYGYDDEGGGSIIPDELSYSGWKFGDKNHIKIMKFWRKHWIDNGMKWWAEGDPFHRKPENWNPIAQLENIPKKFQ